MTEIGRGRGLSNFDHSVDEGVEEELREAPNDVYCGYAAEHFYGHVWYDDQDDAVLASYIEYSRDTARSKVEVHARRFLRRVTCIDDSLSWTYGDT